MSSDDERDDKPDNVFSLEAAAFAKLRRQLDSGPAQPAPPPPLEREVRERTEAFESADKIELLASEVGDHLDATGAALDEWHERFDLAAELLEHEAPEPEPVAIRRSADRLRIVAGLLVELAGEMQREAGQLDVGRFGPVRSTLATLAECLAPPGQCTTGSQWTTGAVVRWSSRSRGRRALPIWDPSANVDFSTSCQSSAVVDKVE